MTHDLTRRRWLGMLAAGAALPACDKVTVEVTDKEGGLVIGESGIDPITMNDQFYVYQYGSQPDVIAETWELQVMKRGVTVATISEAWLWEQETLELEHTLQCIGGNPRNTLISNSVWGGLPFVEIISRLGIELDDTHIEIRFDGADSYHTSIPISDYEEEKLWLMWKMNGEPINYDHGRPCRFICQGRYGTKNMKWPVEVDFIDEPYEGFWESSGWSNDATYRQNGFILQPFDGAEIQGSVVDIFGTAHAGEDPIANVEISMNDGASWQDTEIYYSPGANRWTLWRYRLEGASGMVTVQVRVTTEGGLVSAGPDGTGQSDGYDGGMRIRFEMVG